MQGKKGSGRGKGLGVVIMAGAFTASTSHVITIRLMCIHSPRSWAPEEHPCQIANQPVCFAWKHFEILAIPRLDADAFESVDCV